MAAHVDVLVRSVDEGQLGSAAMPNVEAVRIRMDSRKIKTSIQVATSDLASPPAAVVVQARAADTGPLSELIGGGGALVIFAGVASAHGPDAVSEDDTSYGVVCSTLPGVAHRCDEDAEEVEQAHQEEPELVEEAKKWP